MGNWPRTSSLPTRESNEELADRNITKQEEMMKHNFIQRKPRKG